MIYKFYNKPEVYFLILIGFFLFLFFNNNFDLWKILIVPEFSSLPDETFYDFRCLQHWAELEKIFFDQSKSVYSFSEEIYGTRKVCILNHPRIWILISSLLNIKSEFFFISIIYFLILIYILSFVYQIKKFNSFFLVYFFFSGSSLLLIERGNNDIIIFLLLFLLTTVSQKILKYFIFILTVILKIYPVFGIFYFFDNKKSFKIIFSLSILSIISFVIFYNDIYYLVKNTPVTGDISFGVKAIKFNILKHFNYSFNTLLMSIALVFVSLLIYIKFIRNFLSNETYVNENLFLLGSIIYISIFLLGSHFDYRLYILFFSIPMLINIDNKFIKFSSLISIIISVELHRLVYFFDFYGGVINNLGKIYLFIILTSITTDVLLKKLNLR